MKNDAEYKKLKRIVDELMKRTDFDKERSETLTIHESRRSLSLMSSKHRFNPEYVYEAVMMDMAYRGRLVTMVKKIANTTALVDSAVRAFRTYAYTEYRDELGKTQGDRYAALDRICKPALTFIDECRDHVAGIELIIKDIDQANFQFGRLVDLLAMMQENKGPRNV